MQDFLTFQTFITPTLLIIFYYVGAMIIPVLCWYLSLWLKNVYFPESSELIKDAIKASIPLKKRIIVTILFLLSFLFMEIFWRVMFEFFIAYFDMHDALMKLN